MRRVGGGQRTIRLLLALAAAALLVLILAQVFGPGIAASRISSRVGRYGKVGSVHVRAWPAVELLWGSADSVSVRAKSLSLSPAQAAKLLWEGRGVHSMQLAASSLRIGTVRLSDARLRKHGSSLSAEAVIGEADVKAALPPGFHVQLLGSEAGQVRVTASGGLFGVGATVQAVAAPSDGRLVVHPLGLLLGGVTLTLFSDPHVYVEGVGASVRSASPPSYRLTMSARLR
jgi:LmeA-like phospholipid-binding